jgi:hypothetical protein
MTAEEWIAFRGRMFDFNDYLDSWVSRLKAAPINPVQFWL